MDKGSTRAGVTNFITIIVFFLFSFFLLAFCTEVKPSSRLIDIK